MDVNKDGSPSAGSDNNSFAADILAKYGDFLLRVIRFHINDEALAHDLIQDFYMKLLQKPVPTNIVNMKGYLYRILTRDVIDARRRLSTYQRKLSAYGKVYNDLQKDAMMGQKATADHDWDRIYDLIEKQLPQREAEAVSLRYREKYELNEVAKRMGVNPRSVSRYISMGMKKLRQVLAQQKGDL